jgi:hypothetical protein
MNQRFRNSIISLVCGALTATGAISQEQPAQRDSLEKYRKYTLQERMLNGYCMVSMVDLIARPDRASAYVAQQSLMIWHLCGRL